MRDSCTPRNSIVAHSPILWAIVVLIVVQLACGGQAPNDSDRFAFWTSTPDATQTPIVVQVTSEVVVQVTTTPEPSPVPTSPVQLCVVAQETLYLRPSASEQGYPIVVLENGQRVTDLGGRDSGWIFVQIGERRGWVFRDYVAGCEG